MDMFKRLSFTDSLEMMCERQTKQTKMMKEIIL